MSFISAIATFVFFFFSSHGDHRDLHSFPHDALPILLVPMLLMLAAIIVWPEIPLILPRLIAARSEEHTSELQSRRELVCRLLLEKKKIEQSPLEVDAADITVFLRHLIVQTGLYADVL